eukprot:Em0006g1167a
MCSSSCGSDTSVVWFLNGSVVPGMVQTHQTFSLDPWRAGVYDCAARSSNGSQVERAWVASIAVDPIIAPANQYALIGQSANLSCYNAQKGTAQINWYSREDPSVNGSSSVSIRAVSLDDDHAFICSVVQSMTTVMRTVYLHVIAPPEIQFGPSAVTEITSNSPSSARNVSVGFHSRPTNTTTVLWYKDGNSLSIAANITTALGALKGNSTLLISRLVRRGDGGVYTVVVRNSFREIPLDKRSTNMTFELKVKVLPATPSNVTISTINSSHVAVTWSLCPQAPDESPDAFTLELMTLDGASVSTHHVQGDSRLAEVRVTAGTDYRLRLASLNMDGTVSAAPVLFSAPPEAPSISSAVIYRLNITTFLLTMNLLTNGGADVKVLNSSYRVIGAGTAWSTPVLIPAVQSAELSVRAVVKVTQSVADSGRVEFKMSALNALSFETSPLVLTETVELPGPPHLTIASSSTNLTVIVQLSEVGSPPLLQVVLVVTTLNTYWLVTKSGPYLPGDHVPFTVNELASRQGYIFAAYTVNYAGPGPSSPQAAYSGKLPVFLLIGSTMAPLWVLMTSVLGVLILIALGMMTLLGFARCLSVKQKHYSASEDSISTCVRMYPPQSFNHVAQSSPNGSDTKTDLSTPSDTSPSDRLQQPECKELYVTMSKCSEMSFANELFAEHSSKPTFYYATYV